MRPLSGWHDTDPEILFILQCIYANERFVSAFTVIMIEWSFTFIKKLIYEEEKVFGFAFGNSSPVSRIRLLRLILT
jgi:hypothetical protein